MKKTLLYATLVILLSQGSGNFTAAASSEGHPITKVTFITGNFGSSSYLVAQQLAMEVNRNHPWLRIRVKEGKPNNIHEIANKPDIRKDTFVMSATFTKWSAEKGMRPVKAPYLTAKALCSCAGVLSVPIFTNKPDIKTLYDLKDKKVNLFVKGTLGETTLSTLLKHIGVFDTVKKDYLSFGPAADAMIDGLVDASVGYAVLIKRDPNKFSPIPAFMRMLETKEMWAIDIPAALQKETTKATGVPISPITLPAGSISKGVPERDITTFTSIIWLFADEQFPEELAYEVVKQYATYINAIKKTSPAAASLSVETMGICDLKPEEFHPGAVRFFKEKGIKFGNTE